MIVAIIFFELCVCLFAALGLGLGGGPPLLPIAVWLLCASTQVAIWHARTSRVAIRLMVILAALSILVGFLPGHFPAFAYFHQALFITGAAMLPLLLWRGNGAFKAISFFTIPFGFITWSLANILIVDIAAKFASSGGSYAIFVPDGPGLLKPADYRQTKSPFELAGWSMISARGGGGSGNCCTWNFHALLLTQDGRLFNWSYRTQRFERIQEDTRRAMHLF